MTVGNGKYVSDPDMIRMIRKDFIFRFFGDLVNRRVAPQKCPHSNSQKPVAMLPCMVKHTLADVTKGLDMGKLSQIIQAASV